MNPEPWLIPFPWKGATGDTLVLVFESRQSGSSFLFNPRQNLHLTLAAMAVIERSNPLKRRRKIEPGTELQSHTAKKSRSSLSRHTKPNQKVGLDQPDGMSSYCYFKN
jgi:hypothetical protein